MADHTHQHDTELIVRGDPDKLFFIENLIKDIELVPAILDLVDNSVDSARQMAIENLVRGGLEESEAESSIDLPVGAFDGLRVDLQIQGDRFTISDTCAGISVDLARNYAFRIGRPKEFEGLPGSVGQFGVGMKRALFKLGRWFRVDSRSAVERFVLVVDVDKWITDQAEQDWTFRMQTVERDLPETSQTGTIIEVRRLHSSVSADFSDDLVISLLRQQLRLRHQEAIDRGLEISLNGEVLSGLRPELMMGSQLGAIRKLLAIDVPDGTVSVEIIAGIVRTNRRDLNVDEGNAENFRSPNEAGWWVFCNNRLLLIADKSPETGWGRGAAAYHPQYRLFRGYVYMSAVDTSLLPWNTTKTGVDSDSLVWRKVQAEMVSVLVEVQAVLNRIKKEREAELDDELEALTPEDFPYLRALDEAEPTRLRDLPQRDTLVLPPRPKRKKGSPRPRLQRVQYDVPLQQCEQAMSILGFGSIAELGRASFEYFYQREVEEA
jgi:hypothetical protein